MPGRGAAERRTIAALSASAEVFAEEPVRPPPPGGGGVARNTAIFSVATGVSRLAGLAREISVAKFFGTKGPFSAFTLAFQIPNLVSNLFANAALSAVRPHFHGEEAQLYVYSAAILVATGVQLLMAIGALGRIDFRLQLHIDWHDPRVKQVFTLMLPVTIGLGIVNLDQLINSVFGTLVSAEAPRAIDNAFRVYMLPQGLFSVAVATVLFPTLSRMAARRDMHSMRRAVGVGMRQINLLLIPASVFMIVLATPIVRLLFQRGNFTPHSTHIVSVALFWFAFSLPFGGLNLVLFRSFFAVQRPWIPTRLAAINIVVDIIVSIGLYKPLGIAGLVIGTVAANVVMTALQLQRLRVGFNGRLEGGQTLMITARIALEIGRA